MKNSGTLNKCPVQHFDACFNLQEVATFEIHVTDWLTNEVL